MATDETELDREITDLGHRIASQYEELEEERQAFEKAACEAFAEWFPAEAERAVLRYPDRAQELGLDGLRDLKRELGELIDRIPSIIEEALEKDAKLWPHRGPLPTDGSETSWSVRRYGPRPRPPERADENVRAAWGPLGQLLGKYGLAGGEWGPHGSRYGWDWPEPLLDAASAYHNRLSKFQRDRHRLARLIEQRSRSRAQALWDEA